MTLLPLLILMLVGGGSLGGPVYNYTLTITVVNGQNTMTPDNSSSPYYYLLNQNIFKNSTLQTVFLKSVTLDGAPVGWQPSSDDDGNPVIKILADEPLEAGKNATVELSFKIYLSEATLDLSDVGNISEIPSHIVREYPLTGIWHLSKMANSSEVIATATAIKGDEENALLVVLKMLRWFEDNMVYSSNLADPQDVWQTFATRSGDCDDQANLFVLLCRILGIPAYTSLGPVYLPGVDLQTDNNLRFNLTNVAWHGWAMVFLPTKGGGEWFPVDLMFFYGATFQDNRIRSSDPINHINGSAFAYWGAAEYMSVKSIDYVGETVTMRRNIMNSDVMWLENHAMVPTEDEPLPPAPESLAPYLSLIALLTLLAISIRTFVRRRPQSVQPS
ncbi:MAG: transglutaminase domain-containing protein [Candidatus Verstraetearchaeota archaeon]|nr:transglutaminase domain-containing protein [Candidatus Verstraetearchaeota archaeon]